jgi:ankyrin repeat protein
MKLPGWTVAIAVAAAATPASAQFVSDTEKFIEAVEAGDGTTATQILETRGPRVLNTRNNKGETALMMAVKRHDPQWVGYLLHKGADPDYATGNGDLPLIEAARIGFEQAVEWMLAKGAEVDGTNRLDETALIAAVQQRRAPIVKLLLEHGADPDKTDAAAGYSARDYAKRDTRSRRMLELIESAGTKPKDVTDIDDFKLQ